MTARRMRLLAASALSARWVLFPAGGAAQDVVRTPGAADAVRAGMTASIKSFETPLAATRFASLAAYSAQTGQDRNSIEIDYDIFRNAAPPDFTDPTRLYSPDEVDLRLRDGSAAIDAGTVLPGITDGFQGVAPDLGAYEHGERPPHYGPRPQ